MNEETVVYLIYVERGGLSHEKMIKPLRTLKSQKQTRNKREGQKKVTDTSLITVQNS